MFLLSVRKTGILWTSQLLAFSSTHASATITLETIHSEYHKVDFAPWSHPPPLPRRESLPLYETLLKIIYLLVGLFPSVLKEQISSNSLFSSSYQEGSLFSQNLFRALAMPWELWQNQNITKLWWKPFHRAFPKRFCNLFWEPCITQEFYWEIHNSSNMYGNGNRFWKGMQRAAAQRPGNMPLEAKHSAHATGSHRQYIKTTSTHNNQLKLSREELQIFKNRSHPNLLEGPISTWGTGHSPMPLKRSGWLLWGKEDTTLEASISWFGGRVMVITMLHCYVTISHHFQDLWTCRLSQEWMHAGRKAILAQHNWGDKSSVTARQHTEPGHRKV